MAAQTYESHDELDKPAANDGLGNALIVVTTITLLLAFLLIQKGLGERFNAGMFADAKVPAPAAK